MTIAFDIAPLGMGDPLGIIVEIIIWLAKKVRRLYDKCNSSMPQ